MTPEYRFICPSCGALNERGGPDDHGSFTCDFCQSDNIGLMIKVQIRGEHYNNGSTWSKASAIKETCGSCKFWLQRDDGVGKLGIGTCRRYPPPWSNADHQSWCGEYLFDPNQKGFKQNEC